PLQEQGHTGALQPGPLRASALRHDVEVERAHQVAHLVGRRVIVPLEGAGKRLDVFLASAIADVSRSQLSRHVAEGAVTVNGAASAPSRKLRAGDVVVWTPPPVAPTELVAEEIPLAIVHEDRWLVVVDKPPGLVVHPAAGHDAGTLVNALLAHCKD